ncbi:unnamed protein product [Lymnaea stagnalis]|uniref:Uncharacterized protein n=1 Tax=Lymnaea stagnalis TaxID=6523 RepID=A0AAV2HUY5_LYMST
MRCDATMNTLHILLAVFYVGVPSKGAPITGPDNPITTLSGNVHQKLTTPTSDLSQQAVDWESPLLAARAPSSSDIGTATVPTFSRHDINLTEHPMSRALIQTMVPSSQTLNKGQAKKDKVKVSSGDTVFTGVTRDNENLGSVQGLNDRDGDTRSSGDRLNKKPSRDKNGVAEENDYVAEIGNDINNLSLTQMKLILEELGQQQQQLKSEVQDSLGMGMMCCLVG